MTVSADVTEEQAPRDWADGTATLLVSHCRRCGRRWYLARRACPSCGSTDVARLAAAGTGTAAAVTVIHRRAGGGGANPRPPIGVALIDLDEGVRMMARCPTTLTIGRRVRIGFVPSDEPGVSGPLPSCEEHP